MERLVAMIAVTTVVMLALGVPGAWAEGKVTVTREESKPKSVEIKVGEEVQFINASGGTAHVAFGGSEAIKFYLGKGGG